MIRRRVAIPVAGVALAIGLVLATGGTIAARDPDTAAAAVYGCGDYMSDQSSMMGGTSGMGPAMMGSGTSEMGPAMMGSGSSSMHDLMRQHHGGSIPQATP